MRGARRPGGHAEVPQGGGAAEGRRQARLLVNVTVQRSLGAVQAMVPPESTVADVIAAALEAYAREGRRPLLPSTDPRDYGLHYSQFSLESLGREEKLGSLGWRNFFLCCHKAAARSSPPGEDGAARAPSGLLGSVPTEPNPAPESRLTGGVSRLGGAGDC